MMQYPGSWKAKFEACLGYYLHALAHRKILHGALCAIGILSASIAVFFLQIFIYRACGTNEIKSAAFLSSFWMESS
jgi:hypothetical protein